MNMSKWTRVLLSAGLIGLPAVVKADEAVKPNPVLTALSATTLSGYIDTTATWTFGTGNANMPGRTYDGPDTQDGFNLNVVSLTLDKPLDDSPWASGYHVQMLMGPGAAKRGTGLIGSSSSTDFSFNEAYINLHAPIGNGVEFHIGQFGTYNGYEAYDTFKDPNWSRSYGFYIESSAHTGVSATYVVNDAVTIMAGIGNEAGFNNQVDAKSSIESKKAYLGMISFTAPESLGFLKGATLSIGYTYGDALTGGAGNVSGSPLPPGTTDYSQGNFYAGGTLPLPITGLSLGLAYDYTSGSSFKSSYANAFATYLMWQATEKLKSNTRLDFAWGSNGTFGYTSAGTHNQLMSLTETLDYSLWKNVITRGEFRWDHCLTDDTPFAGVTDPNRENVFSLTMNVIYMF
jgi:Putative beta-barrel porin-2, OmpL-like. bbp2